MQRKVRVTASHMQQMFIHILCEEKCLQNRETANVMVIHHVGHKINNHKLVGSTSLMIRQIERTINDSFYNYIVSTEGGEEWFILNKLNAYFI